MGALLVIVLSRPVLAADEPLRVRTSAAIAPCVAAATQTWPGGQRVAVETLSLRDPSPADVLVGPVVEMTRALEGGQAVVNSDVLIAEVPWVLSVAAGNPLHVKSLADARERGIDFVIFGGPASYEVRRALLGGGTVRVREASDRAALRGAAVALVPLSLAEGGERIAVPEVPPLRTVAAVGALTQKRERAEELVRYLGTEAGQRAFADCGTAAPR